MIKEYNVRRHLKDSFDSMKSKIACTNVAEFQNIKHSQLAEFLPLNQISDITIDYLHF